jgi:hypothetical protein
LFFLGSIASFIRLVYDLTHQASLDILGGQPRSVPVRPPPQSAIIPPARPVEPKIEAAQPVQPPPPVAPPPPPPTMQQPTVVQAKYCAFCGRAIPINARFCPFCQRAQP